MAENHARGGEGQPLVAVVIPTRGRETRLAFALEALAAQTPPASDCEIVVVRDEGAPSPASQDIGVRALTSPGVSGPTAKRNVGWRATTAPLVAFTDDDCRPEPEWLERLLAAAREHPAAVLQGRTVPDPDERHLLHGFARSREVLGPTDWFEASNIAYPRDLLERLDGFDEDFRFGSEDTDLGLRAVASGADRVFVGDASVRHAVLSRTLPQAIRDGSAWESAPLVVKRHPAQRRALFLRLFMKEGHAWWLLAFAGVASARRGRRAPLLAVIPYVAFLADRDRITPRGLLRLALHLPARALVDGTEVAATARSAVRHRVAVL